MAEGFLPFHVPQQSRREKLRFTATSSTADTDTHTIHTFPFHSQLPYNHHHQQQFPYFDSFPAPSSATGSNTGVTSLNNSNNSNKKQQTEEVTLLPADNIGMAGISNNGLQLSLSNQSRKPEFKCKSSAMAMPVGPFTGYTEILNRSRFLKPAQEILDDFCGNFRSDDYRAKTFGEPATFLKDTSLDGWSASLEHDRSGVGVAAAESGLLSLLHQVYKRYKLYCEQIQSAVSSFETVAGLGNSSPFVCLAFKAVSKHFHCLKNAILDYINTGSKAHLMEDANRNSSGKSGFCAVDGRQDDRKKVARSSGFFNHPVWRSQRGFPDKAVAVLKTWLFENFLHPYPSDSDKQMLANQTGLSRCQVSNWFTNARVRLWKPMVEEIHMLEKRSQLSSELDRSQDFANAFANHCGTRFMSSEKDASQNSRCSPSSKRSRTSYSSQIGEQSNEYTQLSCGMMPRGGQLISIGNENQSRSQLCNTSGYVCSQDNNTGLSWSTDQQSLPFWLGK